MYTKGFSCKTARVEEIVLLQSNTANEGMLAPWREILARSWIPAGLWAKSGLHAAAAAAMVVREGEGWNGVECRKLISFFLWVCGANWCLVAECPRFQVTLTPTSSNVH